MTLGIGGKLIAAFVTLIIAVVLLGVISAEGLGKTTQTVVLNEQETIIESSVDTDSINTTYQYTVANNPTGWQAEECPLDSVVISNESVTLTDVTDYTFNVGNGTYFLLNTSTTAGMFGPDETLSLDYNYCGDDYLNLSWGRTLLNLVPGFFAIAILLVSIGLFYSVGKDTGIV